MDMVMKWIINTRRTEKQDSVERACIYMENYCNKGITLQEVADHVGKELKLISVYCLRKNGHDLHSIFDTYSNRNGKRIASWWR